MLTIKCFKNFFLFSCHNNNSTWRLPIATPRPLSPTHHVHEGRRPRREAFMKSSTTLFVFNGKIFVQRGTRGRLTATRLPGTHPSTPPPLDSDSVALLFSRGGTGCSPAPVGSAGDFLLVEAACLELICCYRIVVAK